MGWRHARRDRPGDRWCRYRHPQWRCRCPWQGVGLTRKEGVEGEGGGRGRREADGGSEEEGRERCEGSAQAVYTERKGRARTRTVREHVLLGWRQRHELPVAHTARGVPPSLRSKRRSGGGKREGKRDWM